MRAKATHADADTLHITNQRRTLMGMAYGLRCGGQRLTLTVTPRRSENDIDEWRIDARTRLSPETPLEITAWGPTRLEALQSVGRAWTARVQEHGLAMFDWAAVAQVLTAVRAL